jgi:hypothetical protein
MKARSALCKLLLPIVLTFAESASAANNWYANGVTGNDNNSCASATAACKTIGHAITLARSGDAINIAPATYIENLTIAANLRLLGSGAATTTIDGGSTGTAVHINSGSRVTLSKLALLGHLGGGRSVYNAGVVIINNAVLTSDYGADADGGGAAILTGLTSKTTINNSTITNSVGRLGAIYTRGDLTINRSSITNNGDYNGSVGGIYIESGNVVISNSTISGNYSNNQAGGIHIDTGTLAVNNSTFGGNYTITGGGAISNLTGVVTISNSTISGNSAHSGGAAGGLFSALSMMTVQNSILANNGNGNCASSTTMPPVSYGYNISSDTTCNFHNFGDLTSTDAKVGPLQSNGGPTQTMALLKGSSAIDSGNPGGCTDDLGLPLKTDQRGAPRPDKATNRCDRGAFEVRKK